MRYQLKSIFRNKITQAVLVIIIILNLYTIINLEREAYFFKSKIVDNLELSNIRGKDAQARSRAGAKAMYKDPEILRLAENYEKFRDWSISNNERRIEIYRNLDPKEYSNEFLTMDIVQAMSIMDSCADLEEGRLLSNEVFKEDIVKLKLKENLPYNSDELMLYKLHTKEDKHFVYNWGKTIATRLLNLYKTKENGVVLYSGSPWPWSVW